MIEACSIESTEKHFDLRSTKTTHQKEEDESNKFLFGCDSIRLINLKLKIADF